MKSTTDYPQLVSTFVDREQLPSSYGDDVLKLLPPLLHDIESLCEQQEGRLKIIGINGSQGSGKSTLGKLLTELLSTQGFTAVTLSLDDFYLDGTARAELADQVHPLLRSRGVPGTHDLSLALKTVAALGELGQGQQLTLPRFDKAQDEPVPRQDCDRISGPVQVLIMEGWFLGSPPEPEAELGEAINQLESDEDEDATWRRWVNSQLGGDYQRLFAQLDRLVYLRAPSMDQVLQWRKKQEAKLIAALARDSGGLARTMTDQEIERFVAHFERLTRHGFSAMPPRAHWIIELDEQHRLRALARGGAEPAQD